MTERRSVNPRNERGKVNSRAVSHKPLPGTRAPKKTSCEPLPSPPLHHSLQTDHPSFQNSTPCTTFVLFSAVRSNCTRFVVSFLQALFNQQTSPFNWLPFADCRYSSARRPRIVDVIAPRVIYSAFLSRVILFCIFVHIMPPTLLLP